MEEEHLAFALMSLLLSRLEPVLIRLRRALEDRRFDSALGRNVAVDHVTSLLGERRAGLVPGDDVACSRDALRAAPHRVRSDVAAGLDQLRDDRLDDAVIGAGKLADCQDVRVRQSLGELRILRIDGGAVVLVDLPLRELQVDEQTDQGDGEDGGDELVLGEQGGERGNHDHDQGD